MSKRPTMNLSHIFHRKSSKNNDKSAKTSKKSDDRLVDEGSQICSSSDCQQPNSAASSNCCKNSIVSPTVLNSIDYCSESTSDAEGDVLLQYTPDKTKFPKSYKLIKTLIKEGSIRWSCCKCGEYNNEFKVDRDELIPENLYQPFYMWGDSFCISCYHNFCHSCIEGHHLHHH